MEHETAAQLETAPHDLFTLLPAAAPPAPEAVERVRSELERPAPARIAAGGVAGVLIAWLLGMPFFPAASTSLAGVPLPVGTLLAVGMIGLPALCAHRLLQQGLRALVGALLFAYGLPLMLGPYPPGWRVVFYLGMTSVVLALYEWTVPR